MKGPQLVFVANQHDAVNYSLLPIEDQEQEWPGKTLDLAIWLGEIETRLATGFNQMQFDSRNMALRQVDQVSSNAFTTNNGCPGGAIVRSAITDDNGFSR
jgi:hypothetical protein